MSKSALALALASLCLFLFLFLFLFLHGILDLFLRINHFLLPLPRCHPQFGWISPLRLLLHLNGLSPFLSNGLSLVNGTGLVTGSHGYGYGYEFLDP